MGQHEFYASGILHQELLDCEKQAFQEGANSEGKVAKIMTK